MRLTVRLLVLASLVLLSWGHVHGEDPRAHKRSDVLLFAEPEGNAHLYSLAPDDPIPECVALQLLPDESAGGSQGPPESIAYLLAKRFLQKGDTDWPSVFPILKQLSPEQEMSATIFMDVRKGPCTVLARLPGNQTPIAVVRLSIKPGQHYAIKVPEFVPVRLCVNLADVQNKIKDEWVIVAYRDHDTELRVLSDESSGGGCNLFWALAGHKYSGWVVPASDISSLSRGIKGFELEEWTVAKGSEKGAKIALKVKNPTPGVVSIPGESKNRKENASK